MTLVPQISPGKSIDVTTGAATAAVALPTIESGSNPAYVRVVSTGSCYIDFGPSGVTAAADQSIQLQPDQPEIFNVAGRTHMAYIDLDSGAVVTVSPLENH